MMSEGVIDGLPEYLKGPALANLDSGIYWFPDPVTPASDTLGGGTKMLSFAGQIHDNGLLLAIYFIIAFQNVWGGMRDDLSNSYRSMEERYVEEVEKITAEYDKAMNTLYEHHGHTYEPTALRSVV